MDYTELTVENVLPLFQEEYTEEQISRSMIRIEKAIAQVVGHIEWVQRVRRAADSLVGNTSQPIDKGILMKYMSDFFARNEMRQVYSALREIGYLDYFEKKERS
jgi:type I site-specific restriction endonuclease